MKKIITMVLVALGVAAAGAASTGCWYILLDEPKMPKSLIK